MRVSLDLPYVLEASARSVLNLFWAFVLVFFTCSLKVLILSKVSPRILGVLLSGIGVLFRLR